jgi:hypothetical protein
MACLMVRRNVWLFKEQYVSGKPLVPSFSAVTSKGQRHGIDHLPKCLSYFNLEDDRVESFCLDNDPTGGTSDATARAVAHSLNTKVGNAFGFTALFLLVDWILPLCLHFFSISVCRFRFRLNGGGASVID